MHFFGEELRIVCRQRTARTVYSFFSIVFVYFVAVTTVTCQWRSAVWGTVNMGKIPNGVYSRVCILTQCTDACCNVLFNCDP
jgi:hypothetical protein